MYNFENVQQKTHMPGFLAKKKTRVFISLKRATVLDFQNLSYRDRLSGIVFLLFLTR